MFNGSIFKCHSESKQPDHSKSDQNCCHFVYLCTGSDHSYSFSPNHYNTEPFQIWTSTWLVFECFRYLNVQYSGPYCNQMFPVIGCMLLLHCTVLLVFSWRQIWLKGCFILIKWYYWMIQQICLGFAYSLISSLLGIILGS